MSNKLVLTKEKALDILLDESEDYTIIKDEIIENSRWSILHNLVIADFEKERNYWKTTYSIGATEMQDEGPWEYEDSVKFDRVVPKEVVVTKYVKVK